MEHEDDLLFSISQQKDTNAAHTGCRWGDRHHPDLNVDGMRVTRVVSRDRRKAMACLQTGRISGCHCWGFKVESFPSDSSSLLGVSRTGCHNSKQPEDQYDRTYYRSEGLICIGGSLVTSHAAAWNAGDIITVRLDCDIGKVTFYLNGKLQASGAGLRGRLVPFIALGQAETAVTVLGTKQVTHPVTTTQPSSSMEWDGPQEGPHHILSHDRLTAHCPSSLVSFPPAPVTLLASRILQGTIIHHFSFRIDTLPSAHPNKRSRHDQNTHLAAISLGLMPVPTEDNTTAEDVDVLVRQQSAGSSASSGVLLLSNGYLMADGREHKICESWREGDVFHFTWDGSDGTLDCCKNETELGTISDDMRGGDSLSCVPVAVLSPGCTVTILSCFTSPDRYNHSSSCSSFPSMSSFPTPSFSKSCSQPSGNGMLKWGVADPGLSVSEGVTLVRTTKSDGQYAATLGSISLACWMHSWSVRIDNCGAESHMCIGVSAGGHALNADPHTLSQSWTYCADGCVQLGSPEEATACERLCGGDVVTVEVDMDKGKISFYRNGKLQATADGLPDQVWPLAALDGVGERVTLTDSDMFRNTILWHPPTSGQQDLLAVDSAGQLVRFKDHTSPGVEVVHHPPHLPLLPTARCTQVLDGVGKKSWSFFITQPARTPAAHFRVGVCPATPGSWEQDLTPLGEPGFGVGVDLFGNVYKDGSCDHSPSAHVAGLLTAFRQGPVHLRLTLDLGVGELYLEHNDLILVKVSKVETQRPMVAAVTLSAPQQQVRVVGPRLVNVADTIQRLEQLSDELLAGMRPPLANHLLQAAVTALQLQPGMSALDVGTGSGFSAAVLSCVVGERGQVCSVDSDVVAVRQAHQYHLEISGRLLNSSTSSCLPSLQLQCCNVLQPNCCQGSPTGFDALLCDRLIVQHHQLPSLLQLLKPHGRLVAVIDGELVLVTRGVSSSMYETRKMLAVRKFNTKLIQPLQASASGMPASIRGTDHQGRFKPGSPTAHSLTTNEVSQEFAQGRPRRKHSHAGQQAAGGTPGPAADGVSHSCRFSPGPVADGVSHSCRFPPGPAADGVSHSCRFSPGPATDGVSHSCRFPPGPAADGVSHSCRFPPGPAADGVSHSGRFPPGPAADGVSHSGRVPPATPQHSSDDRGLQDMDACDTQEAMHAHQHAFDHTPPALSHPLPIRRPSSDDVESNIDSPSCRNSPRLRPINVMSPSPSLTGRDRQTIQDMKIRALQAPAGPESPTTPNLIPAGRYTTWSVPHTATRVSTPLPSCFLSNTHPIKSTQTCANLASKGQQASHSMAPRTRWWQKLWACGEMPRDEAAESTSLRLASRQFSELGLDGTGRMDGMDGTG